MQDAWSRRFVRVSPGVRTFLLAVVGPGHRRGDDDSGFAFWADCSGPGATRPSARRTAPAGSAADRLRSPTAVPRQFAAARRPPECRRLRCRPSAGCPRRRPCPAQRARRSGSPPGRASAPRSPTADPVLTRLALGRSNDGSQFGMFLQVFADGTVVDSEGVHHVRAADLKPIIDAVQSGELYRCADIAVPRPPISSSMSTSWFMSGASGGSRRTRSPIRAIRRDATTWSATCTRPSRTSRRRSAASRGPRSPDRRRWHRELRHDRLVARLADEPVALPRQRGPGRARQPVRYPAIPSTSPAGPVIPLTPADSGH